MHSPASGSRGPNIPLEDLSASSVCSPSSHQKAAHSSLKGVAHTPKSSAQVGSVGGHMSEAAHDAKNELQNVSQCVSVVKAMGSTDAEHRKLAIQSLKSIATNAGTVEERLAAVDGLKDLSLKKWWRGFGSRNEDRLMVMEALKEICEAKNPTQDSVQEKVWQAAVGALASLMPESATAVKHFFDVHQAFCENHRDRNKNNSRIAYLGEKYLEVRPEHRKKLGLKHELDAGGLESEESRSPNHWKPLASQNSKDHGTDIGFWILRSLEQIFTINDFKCTWEAEFDHPPNGTEQQIISACSWTKQAQPYVTQLMKKERRAENHLAVSSLATLIQELGEMKRSHTSLGLIEFHEDNYDDPTYNHVYTFPLSMEKGYQAFVGVEGTDERGNRVMSAGQEIPNRQFYQIQPTYFVDAANDQLRLYASGDRWEEEDLTRTEQ